MTLKKWNSPESYRKGTVNTNTLVVPLKPTFVYVEGETTQVKRPKLLYVDESILEELEQEDKDIICRVAASKYITALQLWEFSCLAGGQEDRQAISERITGLVDKQILRAIDLIMPGHNKGLRIYALNYLGNKLAYQSGVILTKGLKYVSDKNRIAKGIKLDTPEDIKRVVVGNQILLGLFMKNITPQMKKFDIMGTVIACSGRDEDKDCIIRTALSVYMGNEEKRYLFEVVRDNPKSIDKLIDKVFRYKNIVLMKDYATINKDGDTKPPQLVICGESKEHNRRIFETIINSGFPVGKFPILFTDDLVWMKDTGEVLYSFDKKRNVVQQAFYEDEFDMDNRLTLSDIAKPVNLIDKVRDALKSLIVGKKEEKWEHYAV